MKNLSRSDWLMMLVGAALGIVLGLFYTWQINPVEYVDTAPSSLRDSYQQEYLALIAEAYLASGNLERAEARLALFELEDPSDQLAEMAQEQLALGTNEETARALAELASDLGARPTPVPATQGSTAGTAVPTASAVVNLEASPSPTIRPSRTPTVQPTAGPPFELADRQQVCDPAMVTPLLQIEIQDSAGSPVAGVEIRVLSDQGEDRFFTGLKPELGLGYADFEMDPDSSYTVQLPEADGVITEVQSEPCTPEEGDSYPGSVLLIFEQPGS